MGKKLLVLLLLAALVFGVAGCGDNTEDILGKVGETEIPRWYYNAYLLNQLDMYKRDYGVDLTSPDQNEELGKYKQYRLTDLVGKFALLERARDMGLDQLTTEQEIEVNNQYEDYHTQYIEILMRTYGTDEAGRQQAEEQYIKDLEGRTLTPERMKESIRMSYIMQLTIVELYGENAVTDEDVRDYYDRAVVSDKEKFEANPASFGTEVQDYTVYIPEGYVDTVRITVKFSSAQQKEIDEAKETYDEALRKFLTDSLADIAEGDLEENEDGIPELAVDTSPEVQAAQQNYERVLNSVYEALMPRMEEIRQKVIDGADFIETMEKESDDTRLISYFVSADSTHVESAYVEAALALENEGDISDVVRLEDRLCIIMLKERLTPGVRSFEEMEDAIRTYLTQDQLINIEVTAVNTAAQQAEDMGIVELYYDKLK